MSLITRVNDLLKGQTESTITILLIALSLTGMIVALVGSPALKLFLTGYFLFP